VARIALLFGALLIVVGLAGYFGTGAEHVTALIPAFIGLSLVLLGWIAQKEKLRMHAMHGAVLVGLVGFIGGVVRLIKPVSTLLSGGEIERPIAVVMTALMTILCGVFVGLCVKSFIDARRARAQKAETPGG
jgi:hypothetical protein